jgi:O-succinylbenzoate synthase
MLGGMNEKVESGLAVGIYGTIPKLLKAIESELVHGYKRVKIKIEPGWDIDPVKAVREAFGDIDLFVDANASYTLKDVDIFKKLDYYGLMMYEQPLPKDDLEGHAKLQGEVETPICLDESATDPETVRNAIDIGACRIINIKIQRVGGISNAVNIHDFCKSRSIPVWCGTMPELGIGQAQGIALASMDNFTYPTDVEPSLRFYTDDVISPFIDINPDGTIDVPDGPGIGYEVSESKLREYEVGRWLIRT